MERRFQFGDARAEPRRHDGAHAFHSAHRIRRALRCVDLRAHVDDDHAPSLRSVPDREAVDEGGGVPGERRPHPSRGRGRRHRLPPPRSARPARRCARDGALRPGLHPYRDDRSSRVHPRAHARPRSSLPSPLSRAIGGRGDIRRGVARVRVYLGRHGGGGGERRASHRRDWPHPPQRTPRRLREGLEARLQVAEGDAGLLSTPQHRRLRRVRGRSLGQPPRVSLLRPRANGPLQPGLQPRRHAHGHGR